MGQPATRLGDSTSHGGTIISGSGDVIIDGIPAGRVGDSHACPLPGHGVNAIASGYTNILINGIPAAAISDFCACGASIVTGSPTVLYGREHRSALGGREHGSADDPVQRCPEDIVRLVFINGFDRPIPNTPITFGTTRGAPTFTTDAFGMIEYEIGAISTDRIQIDYADNRPPVEWPVRMPSAAGKYTIRLSIWRSK